MEQSYKEKYEDILARLERAKNDDEVCDKRFCCVINEIIPELAESEDEKTRKEIIDFLKLPHPQFVGKRDYVKWLAWLERQGADKVEPKFHEGEWITNGDYTWKIVEVKPLDYILQSQDGNVVDDTISHVDEQFHSFTIQDAKDGDVLATKAGSIFIYKELLYDKPFAYCGVDKFGVFKDCNCGNGLDWTPYLSNVTPATKEQRTELFLKMKEAGYEWDVNTKELKKIENEEYNDEDYGIDGLYYAQRILEKTLGSVDGYQSDDGILEHKCAITAVKKLYEHKPTNWSKEDEAVINEAESWLDTLCDYLKDSSSECIPNIKDVINKLKSLKGRVQPKQEWSEEDEKIINGLIDSLTRISLNTRTDSTSPNYSFYREIDWLKSLRHQNRWKPSDEQMEALWLYAEQNNYDGAVLTSLYNDLKKLKEE